MASSGVIHVVSKHDISRHASLELHTAPPDLAPSSVRVKVKTFSLSTNNLSYARAGHILHWWDTFPVPAAAPEPYNDSNDWGIVPVWGYGEVIGSTGGSPPVGTALWGFWPSSSYPVDLELEPMAPQGHWRETSAHRNKVMNIYNRYVEVAVPADDVQVGWTAALKPVMACGYLLNRIVFPHQPGVKAVHPLGVDLPWTAEDGDLSAAVVVNLSASSKTGRGFAGQLDINRDRAKRGPLGLLQVASDPSSLASGNMAGKGLPTKSVAWKQLTAPDTLNWIFGLSPTIKKVVLFDMGAPLDATEAFFQAIRQRGTDTNTPAIVWIGVGSEPKILSPQMMKQVADRTAALGRIQVNTSPLRDRAIEVEGADAYFQGENQAFADWISAGGMGDLRLKWGTIEDVHDTWTLTCSEQLPRKEALVFRL